MALQPENKFLSSTSNLHLLRGGFAKASQVCYPPNEDFMCVHLPKLLCMDTPHVYVHVSKILLDWMTNRFSQAVRKMRHQNHLVQAKVKCGHPRAPYHEILRAKLLWLPAASNPSAQLKTFQ